ncbi:MAG: aminotransferase class V-fold PLP-dependent enzyme [Gammaproteobacteria bacterium]|nr:MAG: aminotransferase class V-fold PLP-dependent enzyme [Gammaproteobacteria bacterium]
MSFDIERARAQTPGCSERIHFNNCGAGLMPTPVIDALKGHIDLEARMGGYEAAEAAGEKIQTTYSAIARMLNCSPREVAVVENATRGWDMAFYAFDFKAGDRILTCSAEYASNYIAFLQVARKTGVAVETVPDDARGAVDVDALRNSIDEHVKLIAITHVPTNGGLVNPAAEIGSVAREHGIPLLLDACQSAGQMPLDVKEMKVDILSATSRKFLRGPRGMGFLYVRDALIADLEPPLLDLHAATWVTPGEYRLLDDARRFENWECNVAAKIAMGTAVNYALDWGLDAIASRVAELSGALREGLASLPAVRLGDLGTRKCGIVSFTVADMAPAMVVQGLEERRINLSVSQASSTLLDMHGRGLEALVRTGIHYYNTQDEVERFVSALEEVIRK